MIKYMVVCIAGSVALTYIFKSDPPMVMAMSFLWGLFLGIFRQLGQRK